MSKKHRRNFIKHTGTALVGATLLPTHSFSNDSPIVTSGREEILKQLIVFNDEKINRLLQMQIKKPGDRWEGGVPDSFQLANVHSTNSFIVTLTASYVCQYSKFYQSSKLERPLEKAAACLLRVQHEDGTIDLHSTNFHSTPDTAFLINYLSPVLACIKQMNPLKLSGFISHLELFFLNAGKCLLVGGIHTANHRWVVCSALARINAFFPSQKYIDRLDEWLSEGIDIDFDGQYSERSVSVYSPICNDMFLTIGRLLDRPKLLDIVRSNLNMTLYYIQPSGEVLTDASERQDRAMTGYISKYYYGYRYFAIKDNNPIFAAVCDLIEKQMPGQITNTILLLLEDPIFENNIVAPDKIPNNYFKRFEHSGVFRIRRGQTDISIIEQNPTFFSFIKGKAVLQSMRLGASFFGRGQFEAEEIDFDGQKIVLKKSLTRGYYQPIPKEKRTGINGWKEFPRDERKLSEAQTINYIVTITESNGKVTLALSITGTLYVPVTLELSFREGGTVQGVSKDENRKDVFYLEKGRGTYTLGTDVIQFGNGNSGHKWYQMRGMLPKQEGISVYITGYTPFTHTIEIE